MKTKYNQQGMVLPMVLVFSTVGIVILSGIVGWSLLNSRAAKQAVKREMAIQIAESGIDYYRWHLAHSPTDYQDGTASSSPYIHQFFNKDGDVIGQFSLDITAPPSGSTLVTIKSTGQTNGYDGSRVIITRLAKPSIAKFAVVANSVMRFGEGTEIYGPIHSNFGIRFDGIAHNIITSAVASYDDPDHSNNNEFGVHTHVNPPPATGISNAFRSAEAPPNVVHDRTDVFLAGRQFPIPAVDYTGLTSDISQMKSDAQADGFYRAGSGAMGYYLTLKIDDTFDLYRVDSIKNNPSGCNNTAGQTGWGTWSVNTQTLIDNYDFPNNGLIFLEDNVFVDGKINIARVTIVAAVFPDNIAQRKNITVNNDLFYTNYDGQDVISLIAQNNFNIGLYSEDDLQIDGALVAQNGRVGRYYYNSNCDSYRNRDTITLYGMLATGERYGFAYTNGSGYNTRNIIYDANLLYSPPPSFPLTSDQYITISWEEQL
jgi:hypothetical protein